MKLQGPGKCSCTATLVDVGSVKRVETLCLSEVAVEHHDSSDSLSARRC